jgi:hypothetical protein
MNDKSNEVKLIRQGFRLFRTREYTGPGFTYQKPRYDIWVWDKDSPGWRIFEKGFPSRAARERRMKEILQDDKNLLG